MAIGRTYAESVTIFARPIVLAILCLGICSAIGAAFWYSRQQAPDPAQNARYLPDADGATLSIDVAGLRRAGVLQAFSAMGAEAEYQQFVSETHFDYTRDLDYVLAVLGPKHNHFLLSGRFDWASLSRYAKSQQGNCTSSICWLPASRPQQFISFAQPRSGLLAMAVSESQQGVRELDALHQSPAFVPETALASLHLRRQEVAAYAAADTKVAPLLRALGPVDSLSLRLDQQLTATILFPSPGAAASVEEPLRQIVQQLESGQTQRQERSITLTWALDYKRILDLLSEKK